MGNHTDEKQRLKSLLFDCGTPEAKIQLLDPVIDNVAWMREKLDLARAAVKESTVAIPDDKGSIRENPLYKGYLNLWKAYVSGLTVLFDSLPKEMEEADTAEKPKTILQIVRDRQNDERVTRAKAKG